MQFPLLQFPSREIFEAYSRPLVDKSNEKPIWGTVKEKELEEFVRQRLGWDQDRLKKVFTYFFFLSSLHTFSLEVERCYLFILFWLSYIHWYRKGTRCEDLQKRLKYCLLMNDLCLSYKSDCIKITDDLNVPIVGI